MISPDALENLLDAVRAGALSPADAAVRLRAATLDGIATVDHGREARCGHPEVVFCQGKEPEDAARIAVEIATASGRVLLTRASDAHAAAVRSRLPGAVHHPRARCVLFDPAPRPARGLVAVVAAGTADLPVAEEAAVTVAALGAAVERHVDVGVAGVHRLFARIAAIRAADAIVAVAGMEGALPSVLAGLVDRPVIAVPTSVGYGVGVGGLVALGTMLASCAAGVTVVNVDNGFGAGYAAARIAIRVGTPPGAEPAAGPTGLRC